MEVGGLCAYARELVLSMTRAAEYQTYQRAHTCSGDGNGDGDRHKDILVDW